MSGRWLLSKVEGDLPARSPLSVLDVGCWDGALLADMPSGFVGRGIEPNSGAVDRARAKGLDIVEGFVEDVALEPASYDLVTLVDVIEHLPHPCEAIAHIAPALRREGALVILTGDAGSSGCRFWGPDWYYFHYPEHVSFFTPASMQAALEAVDLTIVRVSRVRHPSASMGGDVVAGVRHGFAGTRAPYDVSLRPRVGANALTLSRLLRGRDHLLAVARRS